MGTRAAVEAELARQQGRQHSHAAPEPDRPRRKAKQKQINLNSISDSEGEASESEDEAPVFSPPDRLSTGSPTQSKATSNSKAVVDMASAAGAGDVVSGVSSSEEELDEEQKMQCENAT